MRELLTKKCPRQPDWRSSRRISPIPFTIFSMEAKNKEEKKEWRKMGKRIKKRKETEVGVRDNERYVMRRAPENDLSLTLPVLPKIRAGSWVYTPSHALWVSFKFRASRVISPWKRKKSDTSTARSSICSSSSSSVHPYIWRCCAVERIGAHDTTSIYAYTYACPLLILVQLHGFYKWTR